MIDLSISLQLALADFGSAADIDGSVLAHGALFNPAPSQPDPYRLEGSGHDGPTALVLLSDLQAIGEWPLGWDEITINAETYRILRHDQRNGEVSLYLREANG